MLDLNVLYGILLYNRAQSGVLEIVVNHFFEIKFYIQFIVDFKTSQSPETCTALQTSNPPLV